ncbi:GlcG/HbpS family heme-binding protein [Paraburkholderia tagetis]|uniref:Heme-binding protein n=1 Tax=Paraburkholderia tagetis TaxID=2913261 RepID=A0A9X1UMI8_9BURK|nr:heme-binding protein [Paraburkholderia tagetis]MCG5078173.1 heme-binding protein [Paraburkholderia tagetis]
MNARFSVRLTAYAAVAVAGCIAGVSGAAAQEAASPAPIASYVLSYAQTQKLLSIAVAAANARHLSMSFAVVDPGGHLLAAVRMDGAPFATVDFARGKAFASVALGGQSGVTLEQRYRDDPSEYSNVSSAGYYAPFLPGRGVFPVFQNGHLLGAVGAGGAPSAIDDAVLKEAIEAFGAQVTR